MDLGLDMDTNIVNIERVSYDDAYIYQATTTQHLKVNSWKSLATLRLSWKKSVAYKKSVYT